MAPTNVATLALLSLGAGGGVEPPAGSTEVVVDLLAATVGCLLALGLFVLVADRASRRRQSIRGDMERRAEVLLAEFLCEAEQAQLQHQRCLAVPSPSRAGRVYFIPAKPGPVRVCEDGRQVDALCVQPVVPLPDADLVLAHKLMIECCEDKYLAVSNRLFTDRPVWHW